MKKIGLFEKNIFRIVGLVEKFQDIRKKLVIENIFRIVVIKDLVRKFPGYLE